MSDATETKQTVENKHSLATADITIESAIKKHDKVNTQVKAKKRSEAKKYNQLTDTGISPMTPGTMQMSVTAQLHTRLAINLFRGHKYASGGNTLPIIGLARFARQVSSVWYAAALDDPFADQTLLDIEDAYEAAKDTLDKKTEAIQRLLDGLDYFDINIQASGNPVSLVLNFSNPWSFRGMSLIIQFDKLARIALTARHLGVFTDDDWESVVYESQKSIRLMLMKVNNWVFTGVQRADMLNNSQVAQRAMQKYQKLKEQIILNDVVISGQHRAMLSPFNRKLDKHIIDFTVEPIAARTATPNTDPDKTNKTQTDKEICNPVEKPVAIPKVIKKITKDKANSNKQDKSNT